MRDINSQLQVLKSLNGVDKGPVGEDVIFSILQSTTEPYLLYHSLEYRKDSSVKGNVVKEHGEFIEPPSTVDEVDIVLITLSTIYLIEVKAYRKSIKITDNWTFSNGKSDKKSVLHQTEKHARCFYDMFYESIPEGDHRYIVPTIVYVDKCTLSDARTSGYKEYIEVTLRNKIRRNLYAKRYKEGKYLIDLAFMKDQIEKKATYLTSKYFI